MKSLGKKKNGVRIGDRVGIRVGQGIRNGIGVEVTAEQRQEWGWDEDQRGSWSW